VIEGACAGANQTWHPDLSCLESGCIGACCNTSTTACSDPVFTNTCTGQNEEFSPGARCCQIECRDHSPICVGGSNDGSPCVDASECLAPGICDFAGGYESSGVELLSNVTISDFDAYHAPVDGNPHTGNEAWHYVAPSGREYAIMGFTTGTGFVEVTDPLNPVIVGYIDGGGVDESWRDMAVYGQYAYIVNDGGSGPGLQIVDLGNIDGGVVTLVNTTNLGGLFTTAHNVYVNEASGYLYLVLADAGLNTGLTAVNLNVDPVNPTVVGTWTEHRVHDVYVTSYTSGPYAGKEIAFTFCEGNGMYIVDVTDKGAMGTPAATLSSLTYPNVAYCHQGWLGDDKRYLFFGDELDERDGLVSETLTYVVDVQDLANPVMLSPFSNGMCAIDHNLMVRGNYVYEANYSTGLRIFNVCDVNNVVEIGYFDTRPEDNITDFVGAWGVDTQLPSGVVIVSDRQRGLFVLDPSAALAATDTDANGIPDNCEGECQTDADCDDGNACTLDSCEARASTCNHIPEYDDLIYCCNPETGDLTSLDDGNDCTEGFCEPDGAINWFDMVFGTPCGDPSDTDCDNPDTCDGAGTCMPNTEPNGTACESGAFCVVGEACMNGVCQMGVPRDCNDGVSCTDDSCDEVSDTCVHVANNAVCNNGLWCDGIEICDPVLGCIVQPGTVPDCDDGDECTDDSCDEVTDSCVTAPVACIGVPCAGDPPCAAPCTCDVQAGVCACGVVPISGFVPAGADCWVSAVCGDTLQDFADDPIPAGFFDLGAGTPVSLEFRGKVWLEGANGAGQPDTSVARLDDMDFPNTEYPYEQVTPIEIVELHLKECDPIVVDYCCGAPPTRWYVDVTLSTAAVPQPGVMTVTKTYDNGGYFTSDFKVLPKFTFTNVDNPADVRILDTGAAGIPAAELGMNEPTPWIHAHEPGGPSCGLNFIPGVGRVFSPSRAIEYPACCFHNTHSGTFKGHTVTPGWNCVLCPRSCCDPSDGSCAPSSVTGAECPLLHEYKGSIGVCEDLDGDGLVDAYETNDCCGLPDTPCTIRTDPKKADTDGDGVNDGDEITNGSDPCDPCDPNSASPTCDPLYGSDCNGNGFLDICDLKNGLSADCTLNGIPDDCEPDCDQDGCADVCEIDCDPTLDSDGNGIPDECEFQAPALPAAWMHQAKKHRYLSFNPNMNAPNSMAIKVEVAEMRRCSGDPRRSCLQTSDCKDACDNNFDKTCTSDAQCSGGNCVSTGTCVDIAPTFAPPLAWSVKQPYQEQAACIPSCGETDWIAKLAPLTAPTYAEDWTGYLQGGVPGTGLIHVGDCSITPYTTYNVYMCASTDVHLCSAPLVVATQVMPWQTPRNYGDVAGPTNLSLEITPPDGFTSVVDVFAWVLTKQNYGTAALPQAHPTWMDLHGGGAGIPPDYFLTVSDLSAIYIFGFQRGLPWENSQGGLEPQNCP
jgi:choice-of-anchor B domain-containing protein